MIRPIETNLSLFNADNMSNQIKDPNATHAQGAQQVDVKKESEQMSQSVQATEHTDGKVKIGEKERERKEREERRKKRATLAQGEEPATEEVDRTPDTSKGFSFIA